MQVDWPVAVKPAWLWARPVLVATVWPFYAARHLCLLLVPRGQGLPNGMQLVLLLPALLFLALPTRLYQLLGIITLLEDPN